MDKNQFILPTWKSDEAVRLMFVIGVAFCFFAVFFEIVRSGCPSDVSASTKPASQASQASQVPQLYILCEPIPKIALQGMSILLLTIGGALIGGGVSQFVSSRKANELLDEVSVTIKNTIAQPALYSQPEKLKLFRRKFFGYHSTERDGQRIWRCMIFDFTKSPALNRLLCTPELKDQKGALDESYAAEALVRGSQLVLVLSPIHSEPKSIRVFPTAGLQYRHEHWGIATHMNMDQGRGVYRCLLSVDPLCGINYVGDMNEDNGKDLDKVWERISVPWKFDL